MIEIHCGYFGNTSNTHPHTTDVNHINPCVLSMEEIIGDVFYFHYEAVSFSSYSREAGSD